MDVERKRDVRIRTPSARLRLIQEPRFEWPGVKRPRAKLGSNRSKGDQESIRVQAIRLCEGRSKTLRRPLLISAPTKPTEECGRVDKHTLKPGHARKAHVGCQGISDAGTAEFHPGKSG